VILLKTSRQKKILEIVENNAVSTQEELADALRAAGYNVTQATVSRDIKELRLVKVATGENTYRYGLPVEQESAKNEERLRRMMKELVVSIAASDNIVVLKTYPGNAQAVASLIDGARWPEIIGSVAGDDTIILIVKTPHEVRPESARLMFKLKSMME
jgi:transcriptional regulator of arginine metabolism